MYISACPKRSVYLRATAGCLLLIVGISVVIGLVRSKEKSDEAANYMVKKQLLSDVTEASAQISDYYIYGNHFHLEGTVSVPGAEKASLILRDSDGGEKEYPLSVSLSGGKLRFASSEYINDGLCLDSIPVGNYCALIKVGRGKSEYRISAEKPKNFKAMSYYTVTKGGKNRSVKISFEKYFNRGNLIPCLVVKVQNAKLPADKCDIVIDAGHGGLDSGAVCFGHTEAEITIVYAKALKKALEKMGLRVALTRDGSEPASLMTPEAAYKKDGRVERACSSGAKYCLAIHLNSSGDGSPVKSGGVQVYCANGDELSFAQRIADCVVGCAGTYYSAQDFCRRLPGVYVRTFSAADVEASAERMKAAGLEPYETLSEKTTYYYMIRELGGRASGAYIDGRSESGGKNKYYDSKIGIESYLLEIGYINCREDLNNILENRNGYINGIASAVKAELGIK